MERVTLKRTQSTDTHTYGELYYKSLKLCDTIERPWLNNERGVSCIPPGVYPAKARRSPTNGDVWELSNTEPRQNIQIHAANYSEQIRGCIAVGDKAILEGKPAVINSRHAMRSLKARIPSEFELEII